MLPEGVVLGPHAAVERHVCLTRRGAAAGYPADVGEEVFIVIFVKLLPLLASAGTGASGVGLICVLVRYPTPSTTTNGQKKNYATGGHKKTGTAKQPPLEKYKNYLVYLKPHLSPSKNATLRYLPNRLQIHRKTTIESIIVILFISRSIPIHKMVHKTIQPAIPLHMPDDYLIDNIKHNN